MKANPNDLMVHPLLERVMMLDEVSRHLSANHHGDAKRKELADEMAEEWSAFVGNIAEVGVLEPIKVVENATGRLVVDGRHRREASIELGLTEIPIQIVSEDQAQAIIDGTVAGRRHWTKGTRAYFAVLQHPEVAGRGPGNPALSAGLKGKKGEKASNPALSAGLKTAPELAEMFGVSLRLIEQAIELYKKLDGKPKLRERIEPSIWAGVGLSNLLTGLGGLEPTEGVPRGPSSPLTVVKGLKSLARKLAGFSEWTPAHRDMFADDWRQTVASLPPEVVAVMKAEMEACIGEVPTPDPLTNEITHWDNQLAKLSEGLQIVVGHIVRTSTIEGLGALKKLEPSPDHLRALRVARGLEESGQSRKTLLLHLDATIAQFEKAMKGGASNE